MRQMFTFYLLFACFLLNAQSEKSSAINKEKASGVPGPSSSIRLICPSTIQNNEVSYVIDGVPVQEKEFNELNPNEIESIDILKASAASEIFSCRRSSGVILITTKKSKLRSFSIIDQLNGTPIPAATVQFIGNNLKDTLMFTANDQGIVETNQLQLSNEYKMTVSSVGYESRNLVYRTQDEKNKMVVELDRAIKLNTGVIVRGIVYGRSCGIQICYLNFIGCRVHKEKADPQLPAVFTLYPNPSTRGSSIMIDLDPSPGKGRQLSLFTIHGQRIHTQTIPKGQSRIQIPVSSQWTAGVYLVQLVNEKGVIGKQEKIIIQ